jgi:hypothetical protein
MTYFDYQSSFILHEMYERSNCAAGLPSRFVSTQPDCKNVHILLSQATVQWRNRLSSAAAKFRVSIGLARVEINELWIYWFFTAPQMLLM